MALRSATGMRRSIACELLTRIAREFAQAGQRRRRLR